MCSMQVRMHGPQQAGAAQQRPCSPHPGYIHKFVHVRASQAHTVVKALCGLVAAQQQLHKRRAPVGSQLCSAAPSAGEKNVR